MVRAAVFGMLVIALVGCAPRKPASQVSGGRELAAKTAMAPAAAASPAAHASHAPAASAAPGPDEMRVHLIDVGQGAATLLEFACGAILVDTGGEETPEAGFNSTKNLTDYLDSFFARRTDLNRTLNAVFITHPHIDHTLGARTVRTQYTVKNVITDGVQGDDIGYPPQRDLVKWALDEPGVGVRSVKTASIPHDHGRTDHVIDPPLPCGGTDPKLQLLWGGVSNKPASWTDKAFKNENNHSLVLRVDFGNSSLLITGDLQEEGIASLVGRWGDSGLLDVDVYQVGHHGSHNATTKAFLEAMTPKIALIAMGPSDRKGEWTAWQHGHPRKVTVDRVVESVSEDRSPAVDVDVSTGVRRFKSMHLTKAVYATGWDGDVVVTMNANGAQSVSIAN